MLCCLICVSGKKCTGEMECEVRRGREGKREREREMEGERKRERKGERGEEIEGGEGRRGLD